MLHEFAAFLSQVTSFWSKYLCDKTSRPPADGVAQWGGGGGGRLSQRHLKALIGRLLCYCLDAQEPLSSCFTFLHQIVFLNKSCFYLIKVCLYQRCNDLFSPQFSPNLHFWVTVLFWLDIHPTYITKQAFSRVTLSLA